jgi:lipid-A-disaccharide synthase-like uncharacterized protein
VTRRTKCNERIKETAAIAHLFSEILLPIDKMLILIESIGHFLFLLVSKRCVIDLVKMKHEKKIEMPDIFLFYSLV